MVSLARLARLCANPPASNHADLKPHRCPRLFSSHRGQALAINAYALLTNAYPGPPPTLKAIGVVVGMVVAHKGVYPGGGWREGLEVGWLDQQAGGASWLPSERAHEAYGPYWSNITGYSSVDGMSGWQRARAAAVPGVHLMGLYDIWSHAQLETVMQINGSWPDSAAGTAGASVPSYAGGAQPAAEAW